jgi:type IV secretory pathway TraG/TraD family ATPase VirD4
MNEKEKPNGNGRDVTLLLYGAGAFFLVKLYEKQMPHVMSTIHQHRFQFIVLGGALFTAGAAILGSYLWNRYQDYHYKKEITAQDGTSALIGRDESGLEIYLKQLFRTSHIEIIGTTSAGKTESFILPLIIKDIDNGSGLIIIDGKSDKSFLDKLYAYVVAAGREDDFRLFSLADVGASSSFNPLEGGTPHEVVERVFSSFPFENEYYRNVQYKIFLALVRLINERRVTPTMRLVHRLLTDMEALRPWVQDSQDEELKRMLTTFIEEPAKERMEKISGLDAHLSHFVGGDVSLLFNAKEPDIQLDQVLRKRRICYFQLPTMYYPFLAQATGKLVLQCFQSAVAKRHLGISKTPGFFSCYLDDFQDYIYPGFVALLNKSRSANIGIVFSHQALGDLDKVSPAFRNIVLTNTNVKVVMRNNDPETCEYFAKSFGTKTTEKATERRQKHSLGETRTGEGSVREVEEFIFHPNTIRQLGTGEAIVSIPHPKGVKMVRLKANKKPDLPPVAIPRVEKILAEVPKAGSGKAEKPKLGTEDEGEQA